MTRRVMCAATILLMTATTSRAADDVWQFGSAPGFSSGKYGSDTTTTVVQTPFTVRRAFDTGDLTAVLPFLCVRGDYIAIVNGSPVVSVPSGATRTNRGGATRSVPAATPTTPPDSVDACGLGDVVLRGRYYMLDERGWLPTVALRAHVKAPTASAASGLGTGRPDAGFGVEVSRSLSHGFLIMLDGGYTVIGQPTGVTYNNSLWYDVGVGRDFSDGALNLSVFYEEESAIVPGLPSPRDLLTAVSIRAPGLWRLQASGVFGLSDGAPDLGVVLGVSRKF